MYCAASEVLNQSSELIDYNLFSSHSALKEALAREGAATDHAALEALGAQLGTAEMFALAKAANRNPPELRVFDRFGAL
jgi:putative acyl-CoA dehydrogenase